MPEEICAASPRADPKAVNLAPDDTTALWLAGMVEEQEEMRSWQSLTGKRLAPQIQDDPQASTRIASDDIQGQGKIWCNRADSCRCSGTVRCREFSPGGDKSVSIRVSLSPELKAIRKMRCLSMPKRCRVRKCRWLRSAEASGSTADNLPGRLRCDAAHHENI